MGCLYFMFLACYLFSFSSFLLSLVEEIMNLLEGFYKISGNVSCLLIFLRVGITYSLLHKTLFMYHFSVWKSYYYNTGVNY